MGKIEWGKWTPRMGLLVSKNGRGGTMLRYLKCLLRTSKK